MINESAHWNARFLFLLTEFYRSPLQPEFAHFVDFIVT
jgi:hypothetical protein